MLIKVNLPDFIEKYDHNKLPDDYEYDYFNESQIYANIDISFNINNLCNLINGLKKVMIYSRKKKKIIIKYQKL